MILVDRVAASDICRHRSEPPNIAQAFGSSEAQTNIADVQTDNDQYFKPVSPAISRWTMLAFIGVETSVCCGNLSY